jgi:hypothetical protein
MRMGFLPGMVERTIPGKPRPYRMLRYPVSLQDALLPLSPEGIWYPQISSGAGCDTGNSLREF